ncbi:MAG: TatD family hydrolase [Alphaproteobacteria bacterium]|nr:TatD family hydrolase [Alphaproteobacteria bacterium]
MLIDSHCHLNYATLGEDVPGVLARARSAGVGGFLAISCRMSEWDGVIAIADAHAGVWASVGIHPHEADEHPDTDADTLIAATAHPRVIGIGETGLDYYYDKSDRGRQQASFRSHIMAARATGLPLIVHTRDAEADTLALLKEAGEGTLTGVIHCFTASQAFAEEALALGFYISLSGIVTFRNARDLQATARTIPANRLLVETDAPYLAPVPMRGKTCEPAFVAHTARFLADLRGEPLETLAATTTANFHALFTKAAGAGA